MQINELHDPSVIRPSIHTYILAVEEQTLNDLVLGDFELFNQIVVEMAAFLASDILFDDVTIGTIYRKKTVQYTVTTEQAELLADIILKYTGKSLPGSNPPTVQ